MLLLLVMLSPLTAHASAGVQAGTMGSGVVKVLERDGKNQKGSLKVTRRYYTQLDSLGKKLYNALNEASLKKSFTFKYKVKGTMPASAIGTYRIYETDLCQKVVKSLSSASYAYRLDHVDRCLPLDEFDLDDYGYYYKVGKNGKATVVFYSVKVTPGKAYEGAHSDMGAVKKGIEKVTQYVKANRASSSRYDTLYTLAQYMTANFTHGDTCQGKSYTAAGLLLNKFNHTGVCEAYAKVAFTVCKKLNIPVIYVESKTHAYNYVLMENGKWYGYDTDWIDNQDPSNPYSMDLNWFLYGTREMLAYDQKDKHQTELKWINGVRLQTVSISDTAYRPLQAA